MQYVQLMQALKASDDLYHNLPDVLLLVVLLVIFILTDALEHIAIVSILHHNAERITGLVEKGLLVGGNERVFNRR